MRKILKFLSYSLIYMFISVASAYGVISISMNNISNEQVGTGGGSQTTPAVVADEINAIINNLTSSEVIDLEVQASVDTGNNPISISLDGQVDLSEGFDNIQVDANLSLAISQENFDIGLVYQNNCVYFELFNGKFMLATDNLASSIGQITELLGVELPDISSVLGGLDVNSILVLLSNFDKVENADGSVDLIIDISMLEGLSINLSCSSDYHLLGFELPQFSLDGVGISASANIDYPQSSDIEVVNDDDYINITDVIDVGVSLVDYFTNKQFAFDLDVIYDNIAVNGQLYLDLEGKSAKLTVNYEGYSANILFIDNNLYLEFNNIYLKFDLSQAYELCALLENYFGLEIPSELISSIVSGLESGDFSSVIDSAKLPQISLEQIDLSSIDLSIIESFKVDEKGATLIIRDVGQFVIKLNGESFSGISVDAFDAKADLDVIDFTVIERGASEENYVELSDLFPTLENILDMLQSDAFVGNGIITIGEHKIDINYTLVKGDNAFARLTTTLFGQDIVLTVMNGKVYIEVSETKIVCALSNIGNVVEKLLAKFAPSVDITDSSKITETLGDLINSEINPLLITKFEKTENGFIITLLNKLTLSLANGEKELGLYANYGDITFEGQIKASSEVINAPEIVESEYTTIEDLADIVVNVYDYVMGKEFYLTFVADYQELHVEGALNYANEDIALSLYLSYLGLEANVMLYQKTVYVEVENIKLQFSLSDIDSVKTFLNDYFGINLDEVFDELLGKVESVDTESLDIASIIENMTFKLTSEEIVLNALDGLEAKIKLSENNLKALEILYQDISAQVEIEDKANIFAPYGEYVNVTTLLDYAGKVLDYIESKQFELGVDMQFGGQSVVGNLQLDVTDNLMLSANVALGENNIGVNIEDSILYFDYNGLLLKINNDNFNELLYIVLEVLGFDTSSIPFLSEIDLDLDFSMIDSDIASIEISAQDIINVIKMVKEISTDNSALTIKLDGKQVYDNENATDIIITLASENGKIKYLSLDNCYLDSTLSSEISGKITFNELGAFNYVDKTKNYIDISGANELVKAIVNMSNDKEFHVTGTFDILGSLAGIDISWSVPFDILINVVGKADIELYGVIGEIPTMVGVNNDVPYQFDDTNSGENRMLYIYYKAGYIYLYRSETVGQFFGGGRTYEKCTKVAIETFFGDPMYYVQYCFGFTDTIMNAIIESMNNPRTEPMDYGNIIKSFTVENSQNFNINLNMKELINNPDLDSLSLSLGLQKTEDGRSYIGNMALSLYMPLADIFTLTLSTSDARIVDYGKSVDMSPLYDFINNYKYSSETEWEASNGEWQMTSEVLYNVNFTTNNSEALDEQSYHYKDALSLPTLEDYVVDDGAKRTEYYFAGWYEDEKLTIEFTSQTMPRKDLMLYAKWVTSTQNYYTIKFVSSCDKTFDDIKKLEGESIALPSLSTKEVTEGNITSYYSFGGWFTSAGFEEDTRFEETIMPSQNLTLYAKWDYVKSEATYSVNLYDNGILVGSLRVKAGDTIDFSNVDVVDENTKFYYDAGYLQEIVNFTMPESDLDVHIRNLYTLTFTSEYGNTSTVTYQIYQGDSFEVPVQNSYVYDDGTQTMQTTYTFNGYGVSSTIMPNSDVTYNASWTVTNKYYYTITFDILDDDVSLPSSPWKDNAKLYYNGVETTQMSYKFLEGDVDLSAFVARCKYTTGDWIFKVYWYYIFQGWKGAENNIYHLTGDATIEASFSSLQSGESGYNQN